MRNHSGSGDMQKETMRHSLLCLTKLRPQLNQVQSCQSYQSHYIKGPGLSDARALVLQHQLYSRLSKMPPMSSDAAPGKIDLKNMRVPEMLPTQTHVASACYQNL